MSDEETTYAILTRASAEELEALERFIREERPGLSRGEACRVLVREALQHMGVLGVR